MSIILAVTPEIAAKASSAGEYDALTDLLFGIYDPDVLNDWIGVNPTLAQAYTDGYNAVFAEMGIHV